MIWNNFKLQFDKSWWPKMRKFIESEECDRIYKFLKEESKRGISIAPLSSDTFRCFLETPLDELKCVLVGMCPYHTFRGGLPIADGLLMGCSITNYPQPSLDQFYTALENELYNGLDLHCIKNPDVSYLVKQGVLMLNAGLTVQMNYAGSHNAVWEPFMKFLFEEIINVYNVPVIFLGREAEKLDKYLAPHTWSRILSHPVSSCYRQEQWSSQGVFKELNKILMKNNGYSIDWLNTNEDKEIPF